MDILKVVFGRIGVNYFSARAVYQKFRFSFSHMFGATVEAYHRIIHMQIPNGLLFQKHKSYFRHKLFHFDYLIIKLSQPVISFRFPKDK